MKNFIYLDINKQYIDSKSISELNYANNLSTIHKFNAFYNETNLKKYKYIKK